MLADNGRLALLSLVVGNMFVACMVSCGKMFRCCCLLYVRGVRSHAELLPVGGGAACHSQTCLLSVFMRWVPPHTLARISLPPAWPQANTHRAPRLLHTRVVHKVFRVDARCDNYSVLTCVVLCCRSSCSLVVPGAAGLDPGGHADSAVGGHGQQDPPQGYQVLQQGDHSPAGASSSAFRPPPHPPHRRELPAQRAGLRSKMPPRTRRNEDGKNDVDVHGCACAWRETPASRRTC